jgi:hypothetical protein
MSNAALLELAQELIRLDKETNGVRSRMLQLLTANGADPHPPEIKARPTSRPSGRAPPKISNAQRRARAVKAEQELLTLLAANPGWGPAAISDAMSAPQVTTSDRLRRLQAKSFVERGAGGWIATATPST